MSVDTSYGTGGETVVGMNYRILRDGSEIARAVTTSQYVHEEDAQKHSIASKMAAPYFFRVWTKEQNLDLLFLTLVAFARTGAGDDRGGNFGAIAGTFGD